MPELNGIELTKCIRALPSLYQLPIILLSSISDTETMGYVQTLALHSVLTKPARMARLYDALSSAIHQEPPRVTPQRAGSEFAQVLGKQRPLSILLAEDNVINQKVAMRIMERLGYAPILVSNGLEAVEAVKTNQFDVVLMDLHMPQMNGLEAAARIRAEAADDRQPYMIALTADVIKGHRQESLDQGMDDFLAKPIRVDELVAALQRVPLDRVARKRGAPPA